MENGSNDSSSKIESERHIPTVDSDSVNKAVERSRRDKNFISNAVEQLKGLKFPAYGSQIIDYLRRILQVTKYWLYTYL